jgi:regulatory protein
VPGASRRAGGGESGGGRGWAGDVGNQDRDPEGAPADPEAVARLICLRLLSAAPRTRAELAGALRRRRVPEDAAETVLGRFTEVGLIDDATFATAWVESRHHGRGLARRALAAELGRRGVETGDIREAVGRLSPETELTTARALVERKLVATRGQPPRSRARKLVGVLARKGYPPGLAYRVVREALERDGQDPSLLGLDDQVYESDSADSEHG